MILFGQSNAILHTIGQAFIFFLSNQKAPYNQFFDDVPEIFHLNFKIPYIYT